MGTDPLDQDQAILVLGLNDQSVRVSLDVKNHFVVRQKTGTLVPTFDVMRACPLSTLHVNAPGVKWPPCISVFSFEIIELDEAKKLHGSIMTVLSVLRG